MSKGYFERFSRPSPVETLVPRLVPRAEAAAAAASDVAKVVRRIARKGLPQSGRKAAISLRLDEEVLEWFRTQGPGYQTRMNSVLRAYMAASRA
ncbi:MAG: BrnA antitoxin family protein [Gammaproteobacteria bacterium]|nr:BrnA antitoxin family protein [Gammaproteobacteria bacterium]